MSLVGRLKQLAAGERASYQQRPESWPEVVQRAYHVGRRQAFEQAARLLAQAEQQTADQAARGEREMTGPDRARRALNHANKIRVARGEHRRQLRKLEPDRAQQRLAELLSDPPAELAGAPVHVVLCWVPLYGPQRAGKLLALAEIRGFRRVGELTDRQRQLLANALTVGGPR